MDPSFSAPNDPHHPPPFTAFPNPFPVSQHPFYSNAVNSPAVAPPNNNNNQFFQQQSHPSWVHPHYSEMICCAIAALNEADGSSKQAISRYIERTYTGIPTAHGALLTHHLKSLKNSGVLMMVKKSYKLASAAAPPPASVAVEPPRSDFTSNNSVNEMQPLPDLAPTSAPQTQKRGRGRPPKAKPDVVQTNNGNSTWEQKEFPVSRPEVQIQPLPPPQPQLQAQPQSVVKRPPGRPRKDGALPTVKTPVSGGAEIAKRRGRPPSGRAAGRERKPAVVSAPASVIPYVANGGVRRRGRPKRVDAGASSAALPPPPPPPKAEGGGGSQVAKRGRGRPPKIGGVMRKPMKPKRGYIRTGKPLGRPRKNTASKGASTQQDIGYGELKKKFEMFQEKAKDIVTVLKAEFGGSENQAVVQAIQSLEDLTVTTTEEPHHMEEVQPGEQHPGNEQEPEGHGHWQAQTEAEAMQEALF
ncbi:hypothetical protein Bca4012_064153 [Brassica carinata]|uniref:H15 domain-containing protein n=1 Tax=Brassica carinata TaxID=52824 RepID=A0A8X7SEH5_BRACI|nr:hypothetical protein Bca52824_033726 [Brassica carinata]